MTRTLSLLALALLLHTPAHAAAADGNATARAIFAGGCFWCIEADFEKLPGVTDAVSGYIGGSTPDPTYEQVSAGGTGHAEAVEVRYDPQKVSYEELLHFFWRNVDPLTANRQFCDSGAQYRSAIFPLDETQRTAAEASKQALDERFEQPIVTEITMASEFYVAEDDHQDYADENPIRYKFYRTTCGRDARLEEVWGDEAGGRSDVD